MGVAGPQGLLALGMGMLVLRLWHGRTQPGRCRARPFRTDSLLRPFRLQPATGPMLVAGTLALVAGTLAAVPSADVSTVALGPAARCAA